MEKVKELANGGKVLHGPKLQELRVVERIHIHFRKRMKPTVGMVCGEKGGGPGRGIKITRAKGRESKEKKKEGAMGSCVCTRGFGWLGMDEELMGCSVEAVFFCSSSCVSHSTAAILHVIYNLLACSYR